MKFPIISTILLAQGIVSMPWSSSKVKTTEEITLHIQVAQGQSGNRLQAKHSGDIDPANEDLCWAACFRHDHECPEDWDSKQLGNCWTCCRSIPDVTKSSKGSQAKTLKPNRPINFSTSGICMKECWPEEPDKCPKGWYKKNFGDDEESCWTCCQSDGDKYL